MRERWLDEGLAVLAELGIQGVRIDRLAERLGLTKGSFYHHFAGMSGYRLSLLDHYERTYTSRYIDQVESTMHADPRAKLHALIAAVGVDLGEVGHEIAIRAWAAADDDARATVERIDQRRMSYLAGLIADLNPDRSDALHWSQALYLTLIGARHVVPPLPAAEISRVFGRILEALEAEYAR